MTLQREGRRPFIFVVDDERMIADTLALILNKTGFEAIPLYSGEALLEAIEKRAPDALISDVFMEEVSGIDAAIRVREAFPECRIILLSGQALAMDLLAAARANGRTFEFLRKPVEPEEILRCLNRLLPKVSKSSVHDRPLRASAKRRTKSGVPS